MRLTFTQFIPLVIYSFIVYLDYTSTLKRIAIRSRTKQDWGEPRVASLHYIHVSHPIPQYRPSLPFLSHPSLRKKTGVVKQK